MKNKAVNRRGISGLLVCENDKATVIYQKENNGYCFIPKSRKLPIVGTKKDCMRFFKELGEK